MDMICKDYDCYDKLIIDGKPFVRVGEKYSESVKNLIYGNTKLLLCYTVNVLTDIYICESGKVLSYELCIDYRHPDYYSTICYRLILENVIKSESGYIIVTNALQTILRDYRKEIYNGDSLIIDKLIKIIEIYFDSQSELENKINLIMNGSAKRAH